MKNLLFPLILLLGVALLTTSCNDDEDDARANAADINGTTVTLTEGLLGTFGENGNGSYDWDVTLTTGGLDLDAYTGTGSFVYLDLNTNSADGLVSGTYNWAADRDVFTIVDGDAALNFDLATYNADYQMSATGGSVVVTVGDNETEFDINLTLADGETLTAYYKGALTPQ
jgi:hypothetical protein